MIDESSLQVANWLASFIIIIILIRGFKPLWRWVWGIGNHEYGWTPVVVRLGALGFMALIVYSFILSLLVYVIGRYFS